MIAAMSYNANKGIARLPLSMTLNRKNKAKGKKIQEGGKRKEELFQYSID